MANLMVISSNDRDRQLGGSIAETLNLRFHTTMSVVEARNFIGEFPDWLILFDGENVALSRSLLDLLPSYVKPSKIFAITDQGLEKNPHLLKYPFYGYHLLRTVAAVPGLYTRMIGNSLYLKTRGLGGFFTSPENEIRTFQLNRSSHKNAAIEAIQNTLTARQLAPRLAKSIAQGVDELILNAIFDAPIDALGKRYRHEEARNSDFELAENERVQIEFALGPEYLGICVADQFGSVDRSRLFNSLRKHLQADSTSTESGFGLHGIMQSGLSLFLLCEPSRRTEAVLFTPTARTFKDFRNSFKSFGAVSTD